MNAWFGGPARPHGSSCRVVQQGMPGTRFRSRDENSHNNIDLTCKIAAEPAWPAACNPLGAPVRLMRWCLAQRCVRSGRSAAPASRVCCRAPGSACRRGVRNPFEGMLETAPEAPRPARAERASRRPRRPSARTRHPIQQSPRRPRPRSRPRMANLPKPASPPRSRPRRSRPTSKPSWPRRLNLPPRLRPSGRGRMRSSRDRGHR